MTQTPTGGSAGRLSGGGLSSGGRSGGGGSERPVVFEATGVRQVRPTALGRGTHGVSDVRRLVEAQFHVAFPHRVWVAGEVGRPTEHEDGLRFALQPSTGEDPFSLPCLVPADGLEAVRGLLARAHDADVEDVVREGRLARVGGLLRYDAERGAVVFLVSELDPTPTAMELAEARESALAAVEDAGLRDRQRPLRVALAPLQVAVVAPRGDAALARVQEQLADSRYDVDLRVHEAVLTGPDAAARLAGAVRAAAEGSDVVLAVRERGRPLGLAPYDALEVARTVAEVPVPVVAALGGGQTRTAVDEVAWSCLPTADEAVSWLLGRLEEAERRLSGLTVQVAQAADDAGRRCREALATVREETAGAAEQAQVRSTAVRRRRRLQLRVACALLAVAAVALALALGRPLLLLGLLVPLLVLTAAELWWRSPTRRRNDVSSRDDDFTQVLTRLHAVHDELRTTTSPERVGVLRTLAEELVADGERLLGRHLLPAGATAPPAPDGPLADGPAAVEPAAAEQAPAGPAAAGPAPAAELERPV